MTPSTVQEVFDNMPGAFRSDKAQGLDLVFQFHITGDQSGDWVVRVKDGTCSVETGVTEEFTASMTLKDNNWVKLVGGKLNPAMAVMTGKLKIGGDMMAAQKFGGLFKLG
ncbi:MAG: SCP2 sterol-binding domain-containing protein [Desulfarculaceae bacterium]|nr:SCP2 sterol-binding domain-containing protein [Desulfarculaceae bacterium]MCF8072640.1 SCP2 sterol-binding domain-containing protein [Desulfarculaceae bacterium]MCF8102519.1 SCP2 sterol-binding domain-containing protein [Desulfarculaceae bacterium]MCF8117978.1 SCP2 sterol-binding domain-containing protein [Desulfarculaceae bacterium]